ncbi:peptidoglycan glycosyltransferase FtsI [Bowmanella sp. Y26]|uniref:Peptidoglycan D,D-transpeptidase FtsI n=1 Tax=Bowmanella yangjiangensis TaxID=2811230 RepID=A0ABS3CPN5_9ALTE|nr:penicillin-binding transpeptidase domain-containing protein [Bowmanella yangjiangensis]MBN7818230.1 peptidoglycan glycosyltransferase FtsI [Bowmanella yangjiangensis]MBT1062079.1 peptidoglycan glycosyltransferase FtsI [Bowmanella yangjiangensis]
MTKAHAKKNLKPRLVEWRFMLVAGVVVCVFMALVARAAYIQVIEPDSLIQQGDNRTKRTRYTQAHRGNIMDRNGEELAVSVPVRAIYADPKLVHDNGGFADKRRWQALAEVLGQNVDEIYSKLGDPKKRFVYIQRQVSPAMADYVDQLDLPGVYLRNESRRYYPVGEVSAQLVGFTDVDDKGIEGIERLYNDWLTGTPGERKIRRDGKGRQVEILDETQSEPGKDLQLTIDQRIQALTYKELKQAVGTYKAASGSAVVVDIHSGEILAMVNSPSFNPNNRSGVSAHRIRNRAITDTFEPGSTAKPLAVLAALEFGSANLTDTIDTSPGWMRLGGSLVQDARNYGEMDLTGIIRKSSNMGTSKLALSVPKEHFIELYYQMGLIGDTGTHLVGESGGIFHDRSRWSQHELAALSFGYNIAVTSVQLARMYAIIGAGGMKRPLSIIKSNQSVPAERVLSETNANAMVKMLEAVVLEGGTATKARVPGYRVAGKTGTSRKAVAGGYGEEYVNNFAGLAPVSDPQLAVVVMINEPGGDLYHGGDTAAPTFARIMAGALQLLNVPPDDKAVNSLAAVNNGGKHDS